MNYVVQVIAIRHNVFRVICLVGIRLDLIGFVGQLHPRMNLCSQNTPCGTSRSTQSHIFVA